MNVAIDAVGIRGHGGAAVLCELLHWLPQVRPDWRWHVFLFERELREFDDPPLADTVVLEHTRCGDSGLGRIRWVRSQLQKRVRAIEADVLFSFANIGSPDPTVPQVVFVQQHNTLFDEDIPRSAIVKRLRMRFMRHNIVSGAKASRSIIVQISSMSRRLLELEPTVGGRIHVIPSGYRTPAIHPVINRHVEAALAAAQRPRLIYVSHPAEHKNHVLLVRALPIIAQRFPDVQLLFTIELKNSPNRLYQRLTREIAKEVEACGIGDRIIWLGRLNPEEVFLALRESDLMVFPSLSESFGLGLVEAMAAGCPIVAADLSYARDVCGPAAAYFDPTCPESLANMVIDVWSDPDGLEQMRRTGRQRKSRFSYQAIAEQMAMVFEDHELADNRHCSS